MDLSRSNNYGFLPTSAKEVKELGWDYIDVIIFSGDAYVDHPSFGTAVIARSLQSEGYRVAVVPQPSWQDDLRDFKKLGVPRLFFGVNAGNMDSMVNHYTAAKRKRSDDAYTPASRAGMRPDYATVVYSNILKSLYPTTPIVIGGIEASLRRLAHYDYWQDRIKPSILVDSKADILAYGMGDKLIVNIAKALEGGYSPEKVVELEQIAFLADKTYVGSISKPTIVLNSFQKCKEDKSCFGENFKIIETESNRLEAKILIEQVDNSYVVVNPPLAPMSEQELDATYNLPFTYQPHHRYRGKGAISAFEMIKYSVNLHRGCFGGCSFCTISAHQGKFIASRSEKSILQELKRMAADPQFKGVVSDLGGPSANMWKMRGKERNLCLKCSRASCIYPSVCRNLDNNHAPLLSLYQKCKEVEGIKRLFIGSGIRYDMFDKATADSYLKQVVMYHTSGRLKVAPEHTEDRVLKFMRKGSFTLFEQLNQKFHSICKENGLKFELIPYFISSHPGCEKSDMMALRKRMQGLHFDLKQVQDFTPTPMTLSSVIFYTGVDPYSGEKVFVERNIERKKEQKSFFLDMNRASVGGAAYNKDRRQDGKRADKSRNQRSSFKGKSTLK